MLLGGIAFRIAGMYEVHRLQRFREKLAAVEGRSAHGGW